MFHNRYATRDRRADAQDRNISLRKGVAPPVGAIIAAGYPQPVAWLARNLGAHRQNVQRIINDLAKEDLVAFETNPHHRKAQLVVLTKRGKQTFDAAMRLQAPWSDNLSEGLSVKDLETAHRVVLALRQNMSGKDETDAE